MVSDRLQRQIDRLLDEAERALEARDWTQVRACAQDVLRLDPTNPDALAFATAAEREPVSSVPVPTQPVSSPTAPRDLPFTQTSPSTTVPSSFAGGRYTVKRFLGEGGKKKVYLAHDTLLDRDVAFALIKTEGLDEAGRQRIHREAQAMGRLGAHPHIVSVFDLGEEAGGQPYIVTELMGGGDVEGLIEKAPEHRPPLRRTLEIGQAVCRGLQFAHAQQIVHRDLKPGNVWLTTDGAAKIGDFGLAVSLDKTRLTQQGMMVGTVAYMPPEQALGGEATPRADLYSLGAMLYELVTGRPPYAGDDAIAVISQHVNTAPVAPSWHNPAVPPALEGLILRLLAKSPSERPVSAAEVLVALEVIDPDAPVAALSSANPLERLARGVFVGRERELSRLRAAFDEANAGRGGVVMLVGEPGIGKTRTAQEMETYARIRGGQVLWGRAHEAAGAPAYWPWVQALRAYVGSVEPKALSTHLGSGAAEVARIVSEVRERLPGLPEPGAPLEPEAAQFRLFDAIATFLKNAASGAPLLVVLDDLHWADKPSLLLLQHLAREIGRSRLLLVGTYRDVEVGRAHPLAAVLAELQRDALFQRVLLRGLSREEVEAYIRTSAGLDPARELLAAIYQETEGNPFFLSEVVALLVQEGTLQRPESARRGGTTIAVPQSVREVLGRRLDRLSPECNALLILAAIAGREFRYELLAAVSQHDDTRLLALVEEAIEGRVIGETEQAGVYRFSHALVQETLLDELSTTRRVRLHGQVAEALERLYGGQAGRHAAELAQHFLESATLTQIHVANAMRYSKLAAEQAESATAWEEAARHYENCLTLVEAADGRPGDDEAALWMAAGRCWRNAAELRPAWRNLMRAVAHYRERGDEIGLARAAVELLDIELPPESLATLAAEALAGLNGRDPHLEARLLLRQARWLQPEEGAQALARAQDLADRYGYPDVIGRIIWERASLNVRTGRIDQTGIFDVRVTYDTFIQAGDVIQAARMLRYAGLQLTIEGDLDAAEVSLNDALVAARAIHSRADAVNCLGQLAGISFLRGDLARFETLIDEAGRESWTSYLFRAARAEEDGDFGLALSLLPPERAGRTPQLVADLHAARVRIRFSAGDLDGAHIEIAAMLDAGGSMPPGDSFFAHHIFTFAHLDGGLMLLDEQHLRAVYDWAVVRRDFRCTTYAARGYDRMRGMLALQLDLIDEAETWYGTGLEWAERERCPIEQGRCLQGLAEVRERRGQHGAAVGFLDRAAALFQQHGATLYLRQVLAKKDILKA